MKRYTTRFLKSLALGFMAFPVIYILIAAILFDIPFNQCVRILLSPFYYFVALWAVAAGYGMWEMKRWVWYPYVIANFLIGYENAILVNDYGESHHKFLAFVAALALMLLFIYRAAKEIRVPYFFPKIRWWESNPRYRLTVPVRLRLRGKDEPITAEILDVSMGGCFIKLRMDLVQDEVVVLEFAVFGYSVVCEGIVVWRTISTVTHPKGVGIKFSQLDRVQKKTLRLITRRLKRISALYRKFRYLMNQDDFLKRLQEIEAEPPVEKKIGSAK